MLQGDASDAKDSEAKEGPYWSLMFEISESKLKPVNQNSVGLAGSKWPEIVKETIIGALNTKMIDAKDEIVSVYHRYCLLQVLESLTLPLQSSTFYLSDDYTILHIISDFTHLLLNYKAPSSLFLCLSHSELLYGC